MAYPDTVFVDTPSVMEKHTLVLGTVPHSCNNSHVVGFWNPTNFSLMKYLLLPLFLICFLSNCSKEEPSANLFDTLFNDAIANTFARKYRQVTLSPVDGFKLHDAVKDITFFKSSNSHFL